MKKNKTICICYGVEAGHMGIDFQQWLFSYAIHPLVKWILVFGVYFLCG